MSDHLTRTAGRTPMVTTIVLMGVAVLAAAYAVVALVRGFVERTVHLTPSLGSADDARVTLRGLPAGTGVMLPDHAVGLTLRGQPVAITLVDALPAVLGGLGVALGALLLARVAWDIGHGEPFTRRVGRSFQGIAAVVLVVGVLVPLVGDVATSYTLDRADLLGPDSPFSPGVTVTFLPFLIAAMVAVLAGAWSAGTRMRADLEGLV